MPNLDNLTSILKKEKISRRIKKTKKTLKVRIVTSRIKTSFSLKKVYLYDKNLWYIQKKNVLLYKHFYKQNPILNISYNTNKNLIKNQDYE